MRHSDQGKVALVTGGASGIGRAVADHFAACVMRGVLADLDEDPGDAAAAVIRSHGGTARFVRTDVTNDSEVRTVVGAVLDALGRLDVAFNNAGTTAP